MSDLTQPPGDTSDSSSTKRICEWTYDDYDGCYQTQCGKAWFFSDGSMSDNNVAFCMYCGKKAVADYSRCDQSEGRNEWN